MNRWAVALACCAINFLLVGCARLSSLFFVASMDSYNTNRQNASFPYVLSFLTRTLAGPLIGYLGNKYGLRIVTICGCVVSAIGIGGCFFAKDIIAVTVLWGVVYGFGFGVGSALLPSILNLYFEKSGTLANGISLAGSGVGALLLPPIVEILLSTYGMPGAHLILSAIILNSVPAALILKIPESKNSDLKRRRNGQNPTMEVNACHKDDNKYKAEDSLEKKIKCSYELITNDEILGTQLVVEAPKCASNQTSNIKDEKIHYRSQNHNHSPLPYFAKSKSTIRISKCLSESKDAPSAPMILKVSELYRHEYVNLEPMKYPEDTSRNVHAKASSSSTNGRSKFGSFGIFWDPTFIVIMLTQGFYSFALTVIWTIIIDIVRDKGIDKSKEVYFMMFLSVPDLVGRLGLTWVTDGGYMTRVKFAALCFLCLGIGLLLLLWSSGFVFIMLGEVFYSLFTGALAVIFPGIINEFMDSDKKTMAMSSRHVLLAPLCLAVSPLIGYFRGTSGSYDSILYLLSVTCLLCGGVTLLIPYLSRRTKLKSRRQS